MSSLFGLISMPGQSMYNAAKYAVRGFSEALREEMLMAGHPVGVTVVHPGGIKTAIARNARTSAARGPRPDRSLLRREAGQDGARARPPGSSSRRASSAARPGCSSASTPMPLHHFARLTGSRYQDVVAAVARRTKPPEAVSGRIGRVGFELGDPVRIEMEKWGGRPHWHIPGRWLGSDEHGDWIGIPTGHGCSTARAPTRSHDERPGRARARRRTCRTTQRGWLGTFHGPGGKLGSRCTST